MAASLNVASTDCHAMHSEIIDVVVETGFVVVHIICTYV